MIFGHLARVAQRTLTRGSRGDVAQRSFFESGENHSRAQRTFDGGAGKVLSRSSRGKCRNVQALARRAFPEGAVGGVLEWNAPAGEVLRETAPGGEGQLCGF